MKTQVTALLAALTLATAACEQSPPVRGVRAEVVRHRDSDTATVRVRWTPLDTGLVFPWHSAADEGAAAFAIADTAADGEAMFSVSRPEQDLTATFCLRGLRVSDGSESGETCTEYIIPAEPPPLPEPDEIHIALFQQSTQYRNPTCLETREVCRRRDASGKCTSYRTVCARSEPRDTLACLTLRWDSVPGASAFRAELLRDGRVVSATSVNDDSCPGCGALGLEGERWPCFEFQEGCRFNLWPYFSAGWCIEVGEAAGSLEARLSAYRAGEAVAVERRAWDLKAEPGSEPRP